MGGQLNHNQRSQGSEGGRPLSRRQTRPMSDINVTPMVDVMLVLLIVFMITAPLLTVGVPVNLPQVAAKSLTTSSEPVVITLTKKGEIFLKDHETNIDALIPQLQHMQKQSPDMKIYIRGDKEIAYGMVMAVMGKFTMAGIQHVALITELPQNKGNVLHKSQVQQEPRASGVHTFPKP